MTMHHDNHNVPRPANQDRRHGARVIALQRTEYNHIPDRRLFLVTAAGLTAAAVAFGAALVGGIPGTSTAAHQPLSWDDEER